jgi:cob(I)alamin adenosyltransferase
VPEARDGWSIGELADEAGITVRTLHHYDSIGLLRASCRTDGGHRRYSDLDVRRLYEITALRQLGLSLAEIADVVDDSAALPRTMERQLRRVQDQVASLTRLNDQLLRLTQNLTKGRFPDASDLINAMELTTMSFSFDQIVSRTGDDGTTGLADESRVNKSSGIVAAMGDVDELQSSLGVVIDHPESSAEVVEALRHIENDLMDLGADLAQPATEAVGRLTDGHTDWLEAQLRDLARGLDDVPLPILPTGGAVSSHLHVARTVCRRAERSVVAARSGADDTCTRYLNRLSDLLFVMARAAATYTESARTTWSR